MQIRNRRAGREYKDIVKRSIRFLCILGKFKYTDKTTRSHSTKDGSWLMTYEKDICSSCGKHTEIIAKVFEDVEKSYCKECQEKELKSLLEKFNQINFCCIKCGSSNITKNDVKTGISLTDVPNAFYVNAFLTCGDCEHRFYINMEDHGKK